MLAESEGKRIRRTCPEWFSPEANGGERIFHHWTAQELSLEKMAAAVGPTSECHTLYGLASKCLHGSPPLRNTYCHDVGTGSLGNSSPCPVPTPS